AMPNQPQSATNPFVLHLNGDQAPPVGVTQPRSYNDTASISEQSNGSVLVTLNNDQILYLPGQVNQIDVSLGTGTNRLTIDPTAANLPVNITVSGNDTLQGLTGSDSVDVQSGGNATLSGPVTVSTLNLSSGGTLTGSDILTVTGQFSWSGGTIVGSGTLNA